MQSNYASPRPELKRLWHEWIELYRILYRGMSTKPAAPFFSAASSQKCNKRILFVGKATNGPWEPTPFHARLRASEEAAIVERLTLNRSFVEGSFRSHFWSLFRRLGKLNPEEGLNSIIWTNIAKIGTQTGNPPRLLLSVQADLAERTLRTEIEEYRPTLVIFVAANFGDQIVNRAIGVPKNAWKSSGKRDHDEDVWWVRGTPSYLWTRHPERKRREQIEQWMQQAQTLLS